MLKNMSNKFDYNIVNGYPAMIVGDFEDYYNVIVFHNKFHHENKTIKKELIKHITNPKYLLLSYLGRNNKIELNIIDGTEFWNEIETAILSK